MTRQMQSEMSGPCALEAIRRLLAPHAHRVEEPTDNVLVLTLGSRFIYRLLGIWATSRQMPVKLRVEAETGHPKTALGLTLYSNEGWYLYRTSLVESASRARFTDLIAELERAGIASPSADGAAE